MRDRFRKLIDRSKNHSRKDVNAKRSNRTGTESSTFPRRDRQFVPGETSPTTAKLTSRQDQSKDKPSYTPQQPLSERKMNENVKDPMQTIKEDTFVPKIIKNPRLKSSGKDPVDIPSSSYEAETSSAINPRYDESQGSSYVADSGHELEGHLVSKQGKEHIATTSDSIALNESLIPEAVQANDNCSGDNIASWVNNTETSRLHQRQACFLSCDETIRPTAVEVLQPTFEETTRLPITREHITQHHTHKLLRNIKHERHQYHHEHIIQPIKEEAVLELQQHSHTLPTLSHEHKQSRSNLAQKTRIEDEVLRHLTNETLRLPDMRSYIEEKPVHEEVVHKHVIREFHPIIERYVHAPHEHQYYQHIHEVHIEQPTYAEVNLLKPITMHEWMTKVKLMKVLE